MGEEGQHHGVAGRQPDDRLLPVFGEVPLDVSDPIISRIIVIFTVYTHLNVAGEAQQRLKRPLTSASMVPSTVRRSSSGRIPVPASPGLPPLLPSHRIFVARTK
jgi:hypothetical protein